MKNNYQKIIVLMIMASFLCLSCKDDGGEECTFPRAETIAESLAGSYDFDYRLFVNEELAQEGKTVHVRFNAVSDEAVNAYLAFPESPGKISVTINSEAITLTGELFDLGFTYAGKASVRTDDLEYHNTPVLYSGWMLDETRTRCDPYLGDYHCGLRLEFSIGDDNYLVLIGDEGK